MPAFPYLTHRTVAQVDAQERADELADRYRVTNASGRVTRLRVVPVWGGADHASRNAPTEDRNHA